MRDVSCRVLLPECGEAFGTKKLNTRRISVGDWPAFEQATLALGTAIAQFIERMRRRFPAHRICCGGVCELPLLQEQYENRTSNFTSLSL